MDKENSDFLYKGLTYKIIGIAMEIHRKLGCGFLEVVSEEAIIDELKTALPARYEDTKNSSCLSAFVVNLLINYLKATELKVGLLLNFGRESLEWKRIVY